MNDVTLFAFWTWDAAAALLLLGIAIGWLILPLTWPLRRRDKLRLPVKGIALVVIIIPSLFYLFLSILRLVEGLTPPSTTWAQWIVFSIGLCVGLLIEERKS